MRIPLLLFIASLVAHAASQPLDLQAFPSPAGRLLLADGRAVELNDLVATIRSQIKEAVKELTSQASAYALKYIEHYRVKVLRKLGTVTLGSVFRWVFDGIPGLLEDSPGWNDGIQRPTTDGYSGVNLVGLQSHKDPSDSVKDEYSDDVDDDEDDDEPNDVSPDYTLADLLQ